MNTKLTVLLVEDDTFVAKSIQIIIKAFDPENLLTIKQCATLQDAIGQITANGIDVVLLDLALSDSQELEGLLTLRQHWPYLAIIVITGNSMITEADAMRAGACDFFKKEKFSGEDLVYSIRKCYLRRSTMQKFAQAHESQENTGRAIEEAKGEFRALSDSGQFDTPKPPHTPRTYDRPGSGPR